MRGRNTRIRQFGYAKALGALSLGGLSFGVLSVCFLLWGCRSQETGADASGTAAETGTAASDDARTAQGVSYKPVTPKAERRARPSRTPAAASSVEQGEDVAVAPPSPDEAKAGSGDVSTGSGEGKPSGAGPAPRESVESILEEAELLALTEEAAAVPAPEAVATAPSSEGAAAPAVSSEPGTPSSGIDLEKAKTLLAQAAERSTEGGGAPEEPAATSPAAPPAVAAAPAGDAAGAEPPPPAAKPEPPPPAAEAGAPAEGAAPAPAAQPQRPRPAGLVTIKELRYKTAEELIRFVRESFPEWWDKGNIDRVEGKGMSILIVGDTPDPNDAVTQRIIQVADDFDNLELKLETRKIRPRYVDISKVMDAIAMRGIANVWKMTDMNNVAAWQDGNKKMSASSTNQAYIQTGVHPGSQAPIAVPSRFPFIYELTSTDPFDLPLTYGGDTNRNQPLIDFRNTSSTEERGAIMAVGTFEDLEEIQAFVDSIDIPARQILIEVEVVQLEASKLTDLGIDSFQFGERHTLVGSALPLPGESIIQPGFGDAARRNPDAFVPDITQSGLNLIFDDTSENLTGRFIFNLHALVREGDATMKARPKILTLDDRPSILHIGQNVPVFKSTGVTRDSTVGSYVSNINNVDSIYVGFTLNIRPRIAGAAEDEVSLQIEVNVNELGERQRVFAEDLLGIPNIIKRQYVGMNRVKNHRPIVLGGLIAEKDSESVNKIPLLGDIPYLGYLFRRTVTQSQRQEVIFILTPHILSDEGWDRFAAPKESIHFDTYDSVLFNDTHIVKGRDVIGIDPITGSPARGKDGKIFTEEQVVDLTLLNITKERELVSKLGIIQDYLGENAKELNWIERKWPEATVHSWSEEKKQIYFRAAAIVIENIKELNPDLNFDQLVIPRREIILPTTPYRISLSYDKVKSLQRDFEPYLRAGETVLLSDKTVDLLRDASGRSFREFAEFLTDRKRKAEDHGDVLVEIKRLYRGQNPTSNALEGIAYPDVYTELAAAKFDFMSLATYFRENKSDRYTTIGMPNVGLLERDLEAFLKASVSLQQRAKTLMELDARWHELNQLDEEDEEDVSVPFVGGADS